MFGGFEIYGTANVTYKDFIYQEDFDKNGIIYAIGTGFGRKTKWINPSESGLIEIKTHPSTLADSLPKHQLIGREECRCILIEAPGAYFIIDFKGRKIKPSAYTLRNYISWDIECLKNWDFQASKDGDIWVTLMQHRDNTDLKGKGLAHTWMIEDCDEFYSFFKIIMTGENNNKHYMLCCAGFEIYGKCQEQSFIYGMQSGNNCTNGPRNPLTIKQQIKQALTTYNPSFMQGHTLSIMYRYEPDKENVEYKVFSFDPLRNFRLCSIRSLAGAGTNVSSSSSSNDALQAAAVSSGPGLYVVGQNDKGELGIGTKTHIDMVKKAEWAKDHKIVWCSHGYQWWVRLTDDGKIFFSGFNNEAQGGLGNKENAIIHATLNEWYNKEILELLQFLTHYHLIHV